MVTGSKGCPKGFQVSTFGAGAGNVSSRLGALIASIEDTLLQMVRKVTTRPKSEQSRHFSDHLGQRVFRILVKKASENHFGPLLGTILNHVSFGYRSKRNLQTDQSSHFCGHVEQRTILDLQQRSQSQWYVELSSAKSDHFEHFWVVKHAVCCTK